MTSDQCFEVAANVAVGLVAVIHLGFAYKEFSGRNSREFYRKFNITLAVGQDETQIGRIIANSALFNLLLAIGLIGSFWTGGGVNWLQIYLLGSIITAGIVGGLTLIPLVAAAQSVPAVIALVLVLIASRILPLPCE